jgi:VanZ family protein
MTRTRVFLTYWFPPLAWMSLIFYLSSRSGLPDFQSFDLAMKKGAHLAAYGFLYFLLFRAFHSTRPSANPPPSRLCLLAAFVAVLYAVSDEIHQSFVPLRNATARDVLIDSLGIFLMYLLVKTKPSLFARVLRRSAE